MSCKPSVGTIFDIQRYSLHDGPGLRTTVFFKGCPLNCKWCSNPESQKPNIEYYILSLNCIGCGSCISICPRGAMSLGTDGYAKIDREVCTSCGQCADVCPSNAIKVYGQTTSILEVLEIIKRDIPFYRSSGGGITLSGGEPTLQHIFAKELLSNCRLYGISTAIETCGFTALENIKNLVPFLDYIYFDVKHVISYKHYEGTGVDCERILYNLKALSLLHENITIRIPIVPTFNGDKESTNTIADWISKNVPNISVELMAYHNFGENKYEILGREYQMKGTKAPSSEDMSVISEIFKDKGIQSTIIN